MRKIVIAFLACFLVFGVTVIAHAGEIEDEINLPRGYAKNWPIWNIHTVLLDYGKYCVVATYAKVSPNFKIVEYVERVITSNGSVVIIHGEIMETRPLFQVAYFRLFPEVKWGKHIFSEEPDGRSKTDLDLLNSFDESHATACIDSIYDREEFFNRVITDNFNMDQEE